MRDQSTHWVSPVSIITAFDAATRCVVARLNLVESFRGRPIGVVIVAGAEGHEEQIPTFAAANEVGHTIIDNVLVIAVRPDQNLRLATRVLVQAIG